MEVRDKYLDYDNFLVKLREFIANQNYYLHTPQEIQESIRDLLIKSNFNYHYNNNRFYRRLCNEKGVNSEVIMEQGLEKIPMIPVRLFKEQNSHVLLTKRLGEIEFELHSTGTSGIPSISRRDEDTVDNLGFILTALFREYFKISNGWGLFLCPSPAEIPEMGMVKAFNFLSGLLDDRIYLVEHNRFSFAKALKHLEQWRDRTDRHIIGPPFMIRQLLNYMKNKRIRIKLDKKTKIIMLGGWKRFTGKQISRNVFNDLCKEYLGIEKGQIRDMYGLVECNFLAIECEKGYKHVPPWVKIIIRDIDNFHKVINQADKAGLITILDPTSLSYPCFIQTEDVGRIHSEDKCSCGRLSQLLAFKRRIEGAELGCCAVSLEKYIEEKEIIQICQI